MTRKLSLLFLILLVSLFIVTPAFAAQSYYAERFDVLIELQENGSAIITETVEFRFEGDPFTFAFREISANETDGLTFLDASMDGIPMSLGTQAGQVEVEAGDVGPPVDLAVADLHVLDALGDLLVDGLLGVE